MAESKEEQRVAQWKEPRCRAEDGVAAATRLRATSRLYAAAERVHAAHLAANAEAAQSHAVHIAGLGDKNNSNSSSSSSSNNHRNHQRRHHRGDSGGESEGGDGDIVGSDANGFAKDSSNSRSVRLDLSACSFPCIGNGSGVSNLPPRSPLRLSSSVDSDRLGGVALVTASTHSRATVAHIGGGKASPARAEAQAVAAASSSSLARIPSSQHKQQVPSQRAPSRGEDTGVNSVKDNRGNKHARGMFEGSEYRVRPVPRGLF